MSRESTPEIYNNIPITNFTLFCDEEGDAMHFIVQLRDKNEEERMKKLIKEHLGAVSSNLEHFSLDQHTAVLVDDNALRWSHDRDVFRVSYIEECIRNGILLNISQFLKDKSNEFTENFNFMHIVYFRHYSWDSVPDKYKLNKQSIDSKNSARESSIRSPPNYRGPIPKRNRGDPYSRKEKEVILKYVVDHYHTTGSSTLKGRYLWEKMESANICSRTWQSMKEHFLKHISKELDSFSFLTRDERNGIRRALK